MDLLAKLMMGASYGALVGSMMGSTFESWLITIVFCIGAGMVGMKE